MRERRRSPAACLAAARRLRAADEPAGALRWVNLGLRRAPAEPELLLLQSELRRDLGWLHGFLEPLERLLETEHEQDSLRVSIAREYLEYGQPEHALRHVETGLARVAGEDAHAVELKWIRFEALLASGRRREAAAQLDDLPDATSRKAWAHLSAGDVEAADACARSLPDDAGAHLLRARIALWAGRPDEAHAHTEAAVALDADRLDVELLRASIAFARSRPDVASSHVERVLSANPNHPEALVLAGEIARTAQSSDAESLFARAYVSSRQHRPALEIHRTLAKLRSAEQIRRLLQREGSITLERLRHDLPEAADALGPVTDEDDLRERLTALAKTNEHGEPLLDARDLVRRTSPLLEAPPLEPPSQPEVVRALDRALERLGGNRTEIPTRRESGTRLPTRVWIRPDPRSAAMALREGLRVHGFERVIAEHDALFEAYDHHPLIHTHRGELRLWIGAYADAASDFEAAIRKSTSTKWAYVGLACAHLLSGTPDRAIEVLEAVPWVIATAPTAPTVRGEAWRRLGEHERARADFAEAVRRTPHRVSTWINAALLHLREGRLADARRSVREAQRLAPAIFRDLAQDRAWPSPAPAPAEEDLEGLLQMMRGNRSSSFVTYFTRDGLAHLVRPRR